MSYICPLEMCAFIFNALSTESLTLTIYILNELYFHSLQPRICSCQIKHAVDFDSGLFFGNLQEVISQLQTKCQEHVETKEDISV